VPKSIKLLLIEDNRIEARQTRHWLSISSEVEFDVECVELLKLGLERLADGGIDIVLLDLNLPDSRGIETFDKLYDQFPQVPIVVLTGEFDDQIGSAAVEKGAQDYLVKQQVNAASLDRVLRYAISRHRMQQEKFKNTQSVKSAKIIGFLGAKGGVGTTTIALNVATALALQGHSTILVEPRSSFGMLQFHVSHAPAKSLRSLLDLLPERIGGHDLNSVLCKGPAGMRILFGPKNEESFKEIESNQIEAIIAGLSRMADFVILDLPDQNSAVMCIAANLCHFAVVVTEREPMSIMAAKVVVKQLQASEMQGNLVGRVTPVGVIVVAKTIFPNYSVSASELQSQFDCEIVGIVPHGTLECLRSIIDGVPLVLLQPESDTALCFVEMANRLASHNVGANRF
jgi:MinD-like ATPase involved in chromosome partitioning or flagellar assembly/FixJ family two-component response regulator